MRKRWMRWIGAAVAAAVLGAGCAGGPQFPDEGVDPEWTPTRAAETPDEELGQRVIWSGRILAIEHFEDRTQLEVLGFPMDRAQRPRISESPEGRFLIESPDYLEPADFRVGRPVTVLGTVERRKEGRIGERRIHYPVVEPEDAVHLWPEPTAGTPPRSQVRFGLGIQFGR